LPSLPTEVSVVELCVRNTTTDTTRNTTRYSTRTAD
jgi:hypothetical protein